MLTTRRFLREMGKTEEGRRELRKLFEKCQLTEIERSMAIYAFVKGYRVDKTCNEVSMQKSNYHAKLNEILIKIKFEIKSKPEEYIKYILN